MAAGARRNPSSTMPHPAEPVLVAVKPLSEVISAILPGARITTVSIRGDTLEIVASTDADAGSVGVVLQSPSLTALPSRLLADGPIVVVTDDMDESEVLREPLRQLGFQLGLVAALHSMGDVYYCVVVDRIEGALLFDDKTRHVLAAVMQQASDGIGNAALRLQAAEVRANVETIVHLGVALSSVLDLRVIATQTVEYASLLLGLPAAVVLFRGESETDFAVLASEGLPKRLSSLHVTPIEVAGLDVAWPEGGTERFPGPLFDALAQKGLANTFVAPLVAGGGRGAVLLGLDRPERRPTDGERNAFQLLAIQCATAMRSAGLYTEVVEAARLSDALNVANRVVHSTLDIDRVMQSALDTGVEALQCEAAAIEIIEGDDWVVRYQHGFSAETVGTRLSREDAPNVQVAEGLDAPVAADFMPADDGLYAGFAERRALKSVLSVPLIVRTEVVGRAQFYSASSVAQFDDAEIDFGRKLGSTVSLGYENARLYESEHRIAETLQQALLTLPDSLPGVEFEAYYRSATESTLVGGDFYDLFELDSRRVGIIIGDIAGKGLAAAVLTSLVRNTIRAYAFEQGRQPAEILRLTNEVVERETSPESFATVFFGVLDREDGRLRYTSAGHTRSAILRHDATVSVLDTTGPILGAFAGMEFLESTTCIYPGEILFLYTDGLTEARRDGELYGEDRLFAALGGSERSSTKDTAARVVMNVMAFARGHLSDDLAVLAVARADRTP